YELLFIAKGGGSANKTFLFQETKALLNPESLMRFLEEKIRAIGTSACPPYHLAIAIGGTSAEFTLKTVKLASCHALDDLPTTGRPRGRGGSDRPAPPDARDPRRAVAPPGRHAPLALRADDRGARHRAREAQGAPRSRRGSAPILQGSHDLLRGTREDAARARVGVVRSDHGGPDGLVRGSVPEPRRQPGHAREGPPQHTGSRGVAAPRRHLPRLDRRPRRLPRGSEHQGRGG